MARVITSITDYFNVIGDSDMRLGLADAPATPWYLGQTTNTDTLLPALYKISNNIKPELEREMLRDYKVSSVEFASPRGWTDAEMLVAAHMNGMHSRILEWSANPLVALFRAVDGAPKEPGRIWILNPWRLNFLAEKISYVPMTDSDYFKKYVVKLEGAEFAPDAEKPMAFRPPRSNRNYNMQNIFWTVHGFDPTPIEKQEYFMTRISDVVTSIEVKADHKRQIMRALHDLGVTYVNLVPSVAQLTRTLNYRYSSGYIDQP